MKPWKTLNRQTILNHNKFLRVENHVVQLPDGQIIDDWSWVVTPDYVNVVVEREDGRFLIFHQYKHGVGGTSLAPVGGYLEPGEEPLAAAKRELLEETGYEADEWTNLGSYVVDANRGLATATMFLARRARPITEPDADDLEEQELLFLNRDELERALAKGEFKVLPWATAVALALPHLTN